MTDVSDSASRLFESEYATLSAMVQNRIRMEWRYHPGRRLDSAGAHLHEYAREFGQVLRVAYRHKLTEALREEALWYAAVFAAHKWGFDALALLLESWIIAVQGIVKPPECNELAGALEALRAELPALFDAARKRREGRAAAPNPALVDFLLQGDIHGARVLLASMLDSSRPPDRLIVEVLLPAMSEIGERWELDRIEIYQEHLATEALRSLIAGFAAMVRPHPRPNGRKALVSCAPGDEHELIPLALGAYLEIRGWAVKNLGTDLPADQIARAVSQLAPDALFLTFTMLSRLDDVLEAIDRVRGLPRQTRVVVGGRGAVSARAVLQNRGAQVADDFDHGHRLASGDPLDA